MTLDDLETLAIVAIAAVLAVAAARSPPITKPINLLCPPGAAAIYKPVVDTFDCVAPNQEPRK